MNADEFAVLISRVTAAIQGLPLGAALGERLNATFPAGGTLFREVSEACEQAVAAGWMCSQGEGKRKFGRIIQPGPDTHGFSVDVVELTDLVGPHHRHPNGEIDMIMPLDGSARFDGHGAGWLVYGPDSAHRPTVTGGKARILYLLPGGAIEFTNT